MAAARSLNLAEVLGLEDLSSGSCCRGTSYAGTDHGSQCRNAISQADCNDASDLLQRLSRHEPWCRGYNGSLSDLARLLLCRRVHRGKPGQAEELKRVWRYAINNAVAHRERITMTRPASTTRVEQHNQYGQLSVPTSATYTREEGTPSFSVGNNQNPIVIPSDEDNVQGQYNSSDNPQNHVFGQRLPTEEERQLLRRRITSMVQQLTDTYDEHGRPRTNGLDLRSRSSDNPRELPSNQTSSLIGLAAAHAAHIAQDTVQEALNLMARVYEEMEQRTGVRRRRPDFTTERKPLEGDCRICLQEFNSQDSTVWCRAKCGQNFHGGCLQTWLSQRPLDPSCPFWYVTIAAYFSSLLIKRVF